MDSGNNSTPIKPTQKRNKPHKRTPRKIWFGNETLSPEENERVRRVMVQAKKQGRKFIATALTETLNGRVTKREVVAWTTQLPSVPKRQRARCGARTRAGGQCKARVCLRANGQPSTRCRMHGGRSTGPRTEAGREAIRESNRRRAQLRREVAAST